MAASRLRNLFERKSNEFPAVRALSSALDLAGRVVTIDAISSRSLGRD